MGFVYVISALTGSLALARCFARWQDAPTCAFMARRRGGGTCRLRGITDLFPSMAAQSRRCTVYSERGWGSCQRSICWTTSSRTASSRLYPWELLQFVLIFLGYSKTLATRFYIMTASALLKTPCTRSIASYVKFGKTSNEQ